ncbi:hypothetical protein CKAH01_16827 [Colletotrichum kahawae]|uniref:Uncharacterized protein n=1 Tax=Colletotrichum kahawae TaxID=34407 RepID=A0AAD9YF72_COLKA|nr:hypothetical protein CKAH01_16827 [Colletotrichum kahawae]
MDPPRRRPRRLGQSQRLLQRPQNQNHAARRQQRRGGSSPDEAAGWRESIASNAQMPSTSADFDRFRSWDSQSRREVQGLNPTSMMSAVRELQDQLARPIQALETAISKMEDENEKRFKTTL